MAVDLWTGLTAWWPLNETSGNAIVDATGRHANGTLSGTLATTPSWYAGWTAIDFSGAQDIQVADADDLEITSPWSLAFKSKTSTTNTCGIVTKPNAAFSTGYEASMNAGSAQMTTRPVGMNFVAGSPDFNDNTWNSIVYTLTNDGGGMATFRYYLNGVLSATGSSTAVTLTTNTDVLRIASRRGALFYTGALSDVRIYQNRALTLEDAAALFSGVPPAITTTANQSVAENQTAVTTMTATGDAPTWSITGGADAALFGIVGATGVLTFNAAPDYENPQDAGANNVYVVQVTAINDVGVNSITLNITVTNIGDTGGYGSASFSPNVPAAFGASNLPLALLGG